VILTWTCVLDDGTRPFGPGIPEEQRRPLSLVSSDDVTIDVLVINPVGGVIVLGEEEFLQLNGRTLTAPTRELFTRRSVPAAGHRNRVSISGDSTKILKVGRGAFDLWAIRASGRSCLIPTSELLIRGSALGRNYL
jgi:hypothetical protein